MVSGMDLENILLIKQLTKETGLKVKNKEKERLSLKVEVYSKDISKLTINKDMEKCTTILLVIFLKGNGKKMLKMGWEP